MVCLVVGGQVSESTQRGDLRKLVHYNNGIIILVCMKKELQIRNSTVEFLTFVLDGKEDGVQVLYKDGLYGQHRR